MEWQYIGLKILAFISCFPLISLLNDKVVVEEFSNDDFTTYPDWNFNQKIADPITTCGDFGKMFGGHEKFGKSLVLKKEYKWTNTHHYAAEISFNFFKIDTWDNETVVIYADGKRILNVTASRDEGIKNHCGQDFNDKKFFLSHIINNHETGSLELKFESNFNDDAENESWGINNIKITLKECDSTCRTCNMPGPDKCTTCYTNALLQWGKCACRDYYFHKDQYPASNCLAEPCGICESCDLTCKTCSGPKKDNCLSCESGDIFSTELLTCSYPSNSQVIAAELTGKAFPDSELANWDIIPMLDISQRKSTCGSYSLVGGLNKFQGGTVVRRSFKNLPPHFSLRLKIMVLKIDKWEGNKFFIYADERVINDDTFQSNDDYIHASNQCGSSAFNEGEKVYLITFSHTASEIAFELKTNLNKDYTGFWGFANFELVVYKCSDGCSACSEKQDNCLKCQENFFLTPTNDCLQSCPTPSVGDLASRTCVPSCLDRNEYIDQTDRICKTCSSVCKTCVLKSDFCSSCDPPNFLQNNNCLENCLDQFFADISDATCKPCSPPCYNCSDDSKSCLSCSENYYLLDKNCLTSCPDSYFQDSKDRKCKKCSPPCSTCDFPGTSCRSCSEPNFLSSNSCLVNCLPGFWENVSDRRCKPCSSPCSTCSGAGNSCLSCSENHYLLDNTCLTSCPDGYFLDGTNKACKKCSSPCITCEFPGSASSCLSCSEPNFLAGNSCLVNCPPGFWEAVSVRKCEPCSSPCKSCLASPDRCLKCVESFYRDSETCLMLCPLGKWGDKSDYHCKDCASPCKSCLHENGTSCLSCISSYFLSGLLCVKTCPKGYYADLSTNKCSACNDQCNTCSEKEDFCTSCGINKFLYQNKCLEKCLDRYFQDVNERACKPCSVSCVTCSGDSSSCLSCNDSYFLLGTSCVQCLSPCTTCQSPGSSCLSCSHPYFLSDNSCLLTCPSGFWADLKDQKCTPCSDPCKTCSNASKLCLSCAAPLYLESKTCLHQCPSGKWGDKADNTCKTCNYPCKDCAEGNGSKCLSCQGSLFLFEEKCIQNCPGGTFAQDISSGITNNRACEVCSANCKTCNGTKENCTSCEKSYLLVNNDCIKSCKSSQFFKANGTLSGTCVNCSDKCKECFDESKDSCLSCNSEEEILKGSSCVIIATKNEKDYNFTLQSIEQLQTGKDKGFVLIFTRELNLPANLNLQSLLNVSVKDVNKRDFEFTLKLDEEDKRKVLVLMEFSFNSADPVITVNFKDYAFKLVKDKNNVPLINNPNISNQTNFSVTLKDIFESKTNKKDDESLNKYVDMLISFSSFIIFANVFSYVLNVERISTIWILMDALQTISLLCLTDCYFPAVINDFFNILVLSHFSFITFIGKSIKNNQVFYFGKPLKEIIKENSIYRYLGTTSFMCNGFQALILILILTVLCILVKAALIYYLRQEKTEERAYKWLEIFGDILKSVTARMVYTLLSLLSFASFLQLYNLNNPPGPGTAFAVIAVFAIVGAVIFFYRIVNKEENYNDEAQIYIYEPLFNNIELDLYLERNHHFLMIVRKIFVSAVIAFMFASPIGVSVLVLLIHIASILKNIFKNPFSSKYIQFLNMITDLLVCICVLLILIMAINTGSIKSAILNGSKTGEFVEKQKTMAKAFIFAIIAIYAIYLLIGVILFAYYALKNIMCLMSFFMGLGFNFGNENEDDKDDEEETDQRSNQIEMANEKRNVIVFVNAKQV